MAETELVFKNGQGLFNDHIDIGKNYFSGLINQIRKDSRFTMLAEDNLGVIFQLI